MTSPPGGTALLPGDPFDEALRAAVRPPDWRNPIPRNPYDLVVVGAGTGGLVTAAVAAGLGARVALVEDHLMGGDCLNAGCVPSKALISAARAWDTARRAASAYHGPLVVGPGDFAEVMRRVRRLRADLAPADGAERFRSLGVDVFLGRGRFASATTLQVGETTLTFRRAVIATGARPAVPAIPGLGWVPYLTNETVFTLTERPPSLGVVGAGPIGCELAQAFQRLGVAVTLIGKGDRLLPRDDPEAAALVARSLERDGVRLILRAEVTEAGAVGGGVRLGYRDPSGVGECTVARLLIASGRRPNVSGLDVEAAGIAVSKNGVTVDDRLRTTNPRVFAVGDVCSALRFTHLADYQAQLVVQNALFYGRRRASRLLVPWCTYTSPEVAQVGVTSADAGRRGTAFEVITVKLDEVDRARLAGETEGFARFVLARGTDRILGATIVAANAGDLISEVTLAMSNGLGLSAIGRTIHPYPTTGEVLRKAAVQVQKRKLSPSVRRAFRAWFRLTGSGGSNGRDQT